MPRVEDAWQPPDSWDYNLYYNPNSSLFELSSTYDTFDSWQQAGFDVHGLYAEPLFADHAARDFRLVATSPGIDDGTDLGRRRASRP